MTRKELNVQKAKQWLDYTQSNSAVTKATKSSIQSTKIYWKPPTVKVGENKDVEVRMCCDSTTSIIKEYSDKYPLETIGVLNFASYFKPGGGFVTGAYSQEESLCHVSNLYDILNGLEIYNARVNSKKIPPEFVDEVIYTPDVYFEIEGNTYYTSVLSCSAPNCNRARVNMKVAERAIRRRIELIFKAAMHQGVSILVLGAWGCGIMGNSPEIIANIFKEYIDIYGSSFKAIIFPIPNKDRLKIFSEVIVKEN